MYWFCLAIVLPLAVWQFYDELRRPTGSPVKLIIAAVNIPAMGYLCANLPY